MSSARSFSSPSAAISSTSSSGARSSALPLDLPIIALSANSQQALAKEAAAVAKALRGGETPAEYIKRTPLVSKGQWRVALYADDHDATVTLLDQLSTALAEDKSLKKLEAKGVFVREGAPIDGKVAFMFPGQGSQYVRMMSDFRKHFPIVEETIREADEVMAPLLPKALSEYMMPPPEMDEGTAFMELLQTEVLQPAVLAADTALWRLLKPLLPVELVMGHSLGEYGAAIAADVFSFADALRIVAARGEAIAAVADHMDDNGVMIGVGADADTVEALLQEEDQGYVIVANKNCPTQTIIAGATEATMAAASRMEKKGIDTIQLPVSHAFHSSIVSPASPYLLAGLKKLEIKAPTMTLLSNVTAEPYPTDESAPDWIRESLSVHLARPVEWQKMVERAYADGFRYFIEVGPKRALSTFVKDILKGKPHCAAFSAHPKFGELNSLGRMLAQLTAEGLLPYGGKVAQVTYPAFEAPVLPPIAPTFPSLDAAMTTVATKIPQAPVITTPAEVPMAPQPPAQLPPQQPAYHQPAPMQWAAPPPPPMPYYPPPPHQVFADPGFWQFMLTQGGLYFHHMVEQYRQQSMHQYHMAHMASFYAAAPQYAAPQYAAPQYAAPQYAAPQPQYVPAAPAAPTFQQNQIPYSPLHFTPPAPQAAYQPAPTAPAQPAMPAPTMVNMPSFSHPGIPDPAIPVPTETAAYIATPTATTDDLTQTIVNIVADRTGYSTDELGLDEHLEADLGIDSIRQLEVMTEVRDLFGLPRDDNFSVNDYTTLRALVGYVERMRSGGDRPGAQASSADDSGVSG